MSRRMWATLLVVCLAITLTGNVGAVTSPSRGTIELAVVNSQGKALDDAQVWIYGYELSTPKLIHVAKTNAKGILQADIEPFGRGDIHNDFMDLEIHVFRPGHGVEVINWSEEIKNFGQLKKAIKVQLKDRSGDQLSDGPQLMDTAQDVEPMDVPSGIYRTVRVDLAQSIEEVEIGEMYSVPGVDVNTTYSTGCTAEIDIKKQVTFPWLEGWEFTGTYSKTTTNSSSMTWNSATFLAGYWDGMALKTEYWFDHEVWELQEEDGDVAELWHTRERWVSVKVNRHFGSAINGAMISTVKNEMPYADVLNFMYGNRIRVDANNTIETGHSSSRSFSAGAKFVPKIPTSWGWNGTYNGAVTARYTSAFKTVWHNTTMKNAAFYPYDSGGAVWYGTMAP